MNIIERDNFKCRECKTVGSTDFVYTGTYMDYEKVLMEDGFESLREVHKKRLEIDNTFGLQVHHSYRIKNQNNKNSSKFNLPWDYPDDSLITLCKSCHDKFHEKNDVPVFWIKDSE